MDPICTEAPIQPYRHRRVVVTGVGLVTPLGAGRESTWTRLLEGRSGLGLIRHIDVDDLPSRIAGLVPRSDRPVDNGACCDLDLDRVLPVRERRAVDDFIVYAIAAADEALADADWSASDQQSAARTGIVVGSGIGGISAISATAVGLNARGPRDVRPLFIPGALINLAAGRLSIRYGFSGPILSVATACASGAHAIGDGARLVREGGADVVLAGGAEAPVCRLALAGFSALRALSTRFNDAPARASRPWDRDRDGFVMAEGAGMVVLEDYTHARARGAAIYAEVGGYGLSGDAHHITAPPPDGGGAARAMRSALEDARLHPHDVDYVNAHATSTPLGDDVELRAITRVFQTSIDSLSVSSTKSATGHLLGAGGAVEAAFCALAIRDGIVPPTLNLEHPPVDSQLNLTPLHARRRPVRAALSNSFGFGGTNACLVLTAVGVGQRGASVQRLPEGDPGTMSDTPDSSRSRSQR